MAKTSFNTSNLLLRQLLGNGTRYIIPLFQRDYSWTQDEWDDLWQDIENALSPGNETAHYMGYLVLQTEDNKLYQVVDGQQRLTTLSLLALAVLKVIQDLAEAGVEPENNLRRMEQLRNTYIGYLDPVTLVSQPKLSLNKRNNAYYLNYILPMIKLPKARLRSDELLRKAFLFFYGKVTERFKGHNSGANLARFLDSIADGLFFGVITVDDELDAFTVFETLNSRGIRLSPTDLLKNYLFSVVHKSPAHSSEIERLEQRWDEITGRLGEESFPDFLRVHWNSRNPKVRESGLFKVIRENTRDRGAVFALLRNMDEDAGTFAALNNPSADLWSAEQLRLVNELRLFNIRQPWTLLLAARRMFPEDIFTEILRACAIISFRYNIIGGLSTGDQETVYTSLARDVSQGKLVDLASVLRAMRPIYPSDPEFVASFTRKSLKTTAARNNSIMKYILFRLEQSTGHVLDGGSARYSLEHIFPQNPGENWPDIPQQDREELVYRIGNCAILETPLNKDAANADFETKKLIYAKSEIGTTRTISDDHLEWDAGRIQSRQKGQAKRATTIWRISQLS